MTEREIAVRIAEAFVRFAPTAEGEPCAPNEFADWCLAVARRIVEKTPEKPKPPVRDPSCGELQPHEME